MSGNYWQNEAENYDENMMVVEQKKEPKPTKEDLQTIQKRISKQYKSQQSYKTILYISSYVNKKGQLGSVHFATPPL